MSSCLLPVCFTALCALPFASAPSSAQEWRSDGSGSAARAFYTQKGVPAGLQFECLAGNRVRTVVSGTGGRFAPGQEATLVLSVDGLARISRVTAQDEPNGPGSRFVRTDAAADLLPLVADLKRGRVLEVSGPAGIVRLALKGSGKALSVLEGGCLRP